MLLALPYELLHAVCMRLPLNGLLRLAATSRALHHSILTDSQLWRALCVRDVGHNLVACPLALLSAQVRASPDTPLGHYRHLHELHVARSYRASRRALRVAEWEGSVDAMVRVCALGPRQSGKTSLIHLLSTGRASCEYLATDSIDSYTLFTSGNNRRAILRLLDTPGELAQCVPLLGALFDDCDVVLLFAPDSPHWLRFIRSHTDAPVVVLRHAPASPAPIPRKSADEEDDVAVRLTLASAPQERREAVINAVLAFVPPPPSSLRAVPSHDISGPYTHYNYQEERQRLEHADAHPHFATDDLDEDD